MVFESIVTDLLNRYLGEYVENLDKGQLKIGIWGGKLISNHQLSHKAQLNLIKLKNIFQRLLDVTQIQSNICLRFESFYFQVFKCCRYCFLIFFVKTY